MAHGVESWLVGRHGIGLWLVMRHGGSWLAHGDMGS